MQQCPPKPWCCVAPLQEHASWWEGVSREALPHATRGDQVSPALTRATLAQRNPLARCASRFAAVGGANQASAHVGRSVSEGGRGAWVHFTEVGTEAWGGEGSQSRGSDGAGVRRHLPEPHLSVLVLHREVVRVRLSRQAHTHSSVWLFVDLS